MGHGHWSQGKGGGEKKGVKLRYAKKIKRKWRNERDGDIAVRIEGGEYRGGSVKFIKG